MMERARSGRFPVRNLELCTPVVAGRGARGILVVEFRDRPRRKNSTLAFEGKPSTVQRSCGRDDEVRSEVPRRVFGRGDGHGTRLTRTGRMKLVRHKLCTSNGDVD